MKIKVRLFATLREGRQKELLMEFNRPVTAHDIINQLGINARDVAILLVNGMDRSLDNELKEGDIVAIFPPVGGG
ncbi:MAG: molybdopterin synthase sulfur carrier subunit [Bacteroidetes bacterium GWA2_31_9b]|nr:MAG: molybdopterin synthase sulfur carrier subunit [Bacteroidetes bacterium GWA2_31_9b]